MLQRQGVAPGRALYLSEDPEIVRRQLRGDVFGRQWRERLEVVIGEELLAVTQVNRALQLREKRVVRSRSFEIT